jgi:hypothetical protein
MPRKPPKITVCAPVGPLHVPADRAYRCRDCGAPLTRVWREDGLDFTYVGPDGSMFVDRHPPGYAEDPKGWWDRLAKHNPARYSLLRSYTSMNPLYFWHAHRPELQGPARPGGVPFCHGWPMQAVRDGWRCRSLDGTREVFPYDTALEAA